MACAEASSPLPPIESRSCTAGAQQASQWQGWPRHLVALGQFELLKADSLHHLGDGGDRGDSSEGQLVPAICSQSFCVRAGAAKGMFES